MRSTFTIFSNSSIIPPGFKFMKLHALTLAARSYALLGVCSPHSQPGLSPLSGIQCVLTSFPARPQPNQWYPVCVNLIPRPQPTQWYPVCVNLIPRPQPNQWYWVCVSLIPRPQPRFYLAAISVLSGGGVGTSCSEHH